MASEVSKNAYTNQAFINPYAISTDDLTIDELKKANGGFDGDDPTSHYEDTSEVVKKAGLSDTAVKGTGRRKKENIIYEETTTVKKDSKEKPATRKRNSELPPRPHEKNETLLPNSNNWRTPFAVLCVLVLLAIIGGAFGALAYFDDAKCSCETTSHVAAIVGEPNTSSTIKAKAIEQLNEKLVSLENELQALKNEQEKQSNLHGKLNSSVTEVVSRLTTELRNTNSDVSLLTQDVSSFNISLNKFTGELDTKIGSLNVTLSSQLRNISKQQGPRGYNGTQGIQGPPGVGNLSLCQVKTEVKKVELFDAFPLLTLTSKSVTERPGYKIMGAVCSTEEDYGAGQTVLTVTENSSKYTCTCYGDSKFGNLVPQEEDNGNLYTKCVIHYWECPIIT